MYKVTVVDWGDNAYAQYGSSKVVHEFTTDMIPSICHDGGRLDITGWPETIWVSSHQFSVEIELAGT